MLRSMLQRWRITRQLRGYRPQPVTMKAVGRWLSQFSKKDHRALLDLLSRVRYFSEEDTRRALVELNERLLERLKSAGIPLEKVIYVQVDEAGSSSPVMLNMLRDAALLERRGCEFCDSRDILGFQRITNSLEEGAVVYVDDFAGTGDQFKRSRRYISQYIVGNFVEFFLLPCICEEAAELLRAEGLELMYAHLHTRNERPLHEKCQILPSGVKARLIRLCEETSGKLGGGLGYGKLATMVVFYRNATNHVPSVLRGSRSQDKYIGVIPRTTDLPCG